ncbi:MAG: hypothetical protein HXY51_06700 [Nitrospirae bacterium]|nr:hypothetical protein [Nitrospirota bacterium]
MIQLGRFISLILFLTMAGALSGPAGWAETGTSDLGAVRQDARCAWYGNCGYGERDWATLPVHDLVAILSICAEVTYTGCPMIKRS